MQRPEFVNRHRFQISPFGRRHNKPSAHIAPFPPDDILFIWRIGKPSPDRRLDRVAVQRGHTSWDKTARLGAHPCHNQTNCPVADPAQSNISRLENREKSPDICRAPAGSPKQISKFLRSRSRHAIARSGHFLDWLHAHSICPVLSLADKSLVETGL